MEKTWWESFKCSVEMTERDRINQRAVTAWVFVWALSWVGATFLIDRVLATGGAIALATALAPNILGIVAIRAYIKFLREAEELHRKVQTDALAIGFGVGMISMVGLELLGDVGLINPDPSAALIFMAVAYSLGVTLGWRRYR